MKLKHILPTVATCIAICAFSAAQALLAPLATRIAASFGHGFGWCGFLYAACYIPYILIGPFTGKLFSALGRHLSVSLALGLCAVPMLLLPFADRFSLVCLCFLLWGVGSVFALLAAVEAVSAITGKGHAFALTLFGVVLGFAAAAASLSAAVLVYLHWNWKKIYFYFGILTAVLSVLHIVIPFPRQPAPDPLEWKAEMRSAMRLQRMYPCFFAAFLYGGTETIAAGWIAAYMTHSLGYTSVIAAIAIGVIWIFAGLGRFMCIKFSGRFSPKALSATLTLILVLSLCLCTAMSDGRVFWFAVCGIGLGLSGFCPLILQAGLSVNNGSGATLAVLLQWSCAGSAILSFLAGAIGMTMGMRLVMALAIVLTVTVCSFLHAVSPSAAAAKLPPQPQAKPDPAAKKMEEALQVMREFGDFENFQDFDFQDYNVFEDGEDFDSYFDERDYGQLIQFERYAERVKRHTHPVHGELDYHDNLVQFPGSYQKPAGEPDAFADSTYFEGETEPFAEPEYLDDGQEAFDGLGYSGDGQEAFDGSGYSDGGQEAFDDSGYSDGGQEAFDGSGYPDGEEAFDGSEYPEPFADPPAHPDAAPGPLVEGQLAFDDAAPDKQAPAPPEEPAGDTDP